MPRVIDETDFDQQSYPWDEWTDGKAREFSHGIDFGCTPESFQAMAYRIAHARQLKVRTQRRGDKVRLMFCRS